jgi:multicomponent Na+:H+ antiporter subunit D
MTASTLAHAIPPGLLLFAGALLIPLFRGHLRSAYMLALPVVGLLQLLLLEKGSYLGVSVLGLDLVLLRVDQLALVFGYIFHIAAFISVIYALHVKDTPQHVSALTYAGAAIGAVFVGDLVSLFVYWELTAVTSAFLIFARRTPRAFHAGMRYLIIQVGSGVLLLTGIILHFLDVGSVAFNHLGVVSPATALILVAFGIKCAFPLLHNWLEDAYPEATVTGTVFLSAFTTKLAVYALTRGYAGTEILIWIGATMTAFPIFYAVIENDLRRVLAYSLNNQLGFMVTGIGIGTDMAINGTVAHAFSHILYKALLFMSMGAVLHRVGTIKGSELGGLYKSMPWTAMMCIVGAASISAFPLFSGFISKALIITAAAENGFVIVWLVLLFASAGVFHHSGIKIPYFAFFAHDSGKRCAEAPWNMLLAMGIAATFCIGIGVFPDALYRILPFQVNFAPYTPTHVLTQLQLLLFSALAFAVLIRTGVYPPELRSTNLDSDWLYRRFGVNTVTAGARWIDRTARTLKDDMKLQLKDFVAGVTRHHGPKGAMARTWPTGSTVLWVAILLGAFLIASFYA